MPHIVLIAEGTSLVIKLLEQGKIDAVIGASCLSALEKTFPHLAAGAIPGLALPLWKDGCIGTQVDVDWIREAMYMEAETSASRPVDIPSVRGEVEALFAPEKLKSLTGADGEWLETVGLDWLAVAGGFSFALNNVMLRREAHRPEEARALAMFFGGMAVAGVLALALTGGGVIGGLPAPATGWLAGVAAMALLFLIANIALQYGAARLPANVTSVVMLTEILFASLSALALGGGTLDAQLLTGGGLILLAALLSTLQRADAH